MQNIHTRYYGDLSFEKTWSQNNGAHVGRLTNGSYAHIGGLPVTDEADLIAVIPAGKQLDEAIDWFHNRAKRAEEAAKLPSRLVMFYPPDQSWRFVDTNLPVDKVEDLYEALKGSTALESALAWFFKERQQVDRGAPRSGTLVPGGDGIDDRIVRVLGEARQEGATINDLGKHLAMDPKSLLDLANSLHDQEVILRWEKRYYLPTYAPASATKRSAATVDQ